MSRATTQALAAPTGPALARPVLAATVLAVAVLGAVLSGCTGAAGSAAPDAEQVRTITVVAASDLRPAFEELGARFTERSGVDVVFAFGSSGQLREQIINGAPFDLFASANVEFVDAVIDAGRGDASTKADYAIGRIVVWTPPGTAPPSDIGDLADPRFRRIAIANPAHAPYGLAAEQALIASGIHPSVSSRLVYGDNVSDAFRIVASGNADAGIVALSLAIADGSEYTEIPEELHAPLRQALVVTSTGAAGARASEFAAFLGSPEGRAVMSRAGFALPGEQTGGVDD